LGCYFSSSINGRERSFKRFDLARDCAILLANEQSGHSAGTRYPSAESGEGFRWRAWPCPACRGGLTPIRHLRRSIQTGATLPEDLDHPEQVADSQAQSLLSWVKSRPHTQWREATFTQPAEGSEHVVYFDSTDAQVWKITRPGVFGDSYYLVNELVHQRNNSPLGYLMRLRLWKTVFESAPRAVGITPQGQIFLSMNSFPDQRQTKKKRIRSSSKRG
jgi:hypothetical protein